MYYKALINKSDVEIVIGWKNTGMKKNCQKMAHAYMIKLHCRLPGIKMASYLVSH